MPRKTITIFGATGAQGSSVLRSLSANASKAFALRGITRDPASRAAQALSALDVEVVKADGWDKKSMVIAFQGSWGAFVNTNSEDPAGVQVLVYSGLSSAKEITRGKVANRAFDAISEYAKSIGTFQSVIITSPGWYFENFLNQDSAKAFGEFPYFPQEDGTLLYRVPKWGGKERVPFVAIADDFGDIVHGVFLEPETWNRKFIQGVSDIRSFAAAVQSFERVTRIQARFEEIPRWQDFETCGIGALETVKLTFGVCQESGGLYYGAEPEIETAAGLKRAVAKASGRDIAESKLLTLDEFFEREFRAG
ncbi:hypothetical protein ACEQ8H_008442 [Pleosporales sp. CAS-2024a]